MESDIIEKKIFELIEGLTKLKTTADLSFQSVNQAISELSKLIEKTCENFNANKDEIILIKQRLKDLEAENKIFKGSYAHMVRRIEAIESELKIFVKVFMRKINWKKLSKWILIGATILGFIASVFDNFNQVKSLFKKIF